jgi:hypothetical protein
LKPSCLEKVGANCRIGCASANAEVLLKFAVNSKSNSATGSEMSFIVGKIKNKKKWIGTPLDLGSLKALE